VVPVTPDFDHAVSLRPLVRIGSTFGAHAPLLAAARSMASTVTLKAVAMPIDDPGRAIVDRVVDVALLMGSTRYDRHLHRVPLFGEARVAVLRDHGGPGDAGRLPLAVLDRFEWPSLPEHGDHRYLQPWICSDVRPGPPPRQGPVVTDPSAMQEWMEADGSQAVMATTPYLAGAFAGVDGYVVAPIADVPGWPVSLAGPRSARRQIDELARLLLAATRPPATVSGIVGS
jgi:DNA-binding transcriptional LysR family regulator